MDQTLCDAIAKLQANPDWLDLSDKYFVLIGATSEMGPLRFLLSHGVLHVSHCQAYTSTTHQQDIETRGHAFLRRDRGKRDRDRPTERKVGQPARHGKTR